jgi:hypothetical protein
MKTIYKFGVYLALFCAAIPIFAQDRIIDKKEYDSIYQKSQPFLENRAYRSTSISEQYNRGGSPETRTSVYEFVPPDRYHSVYSWTDSKGLRKSESITIGDQMWNRMDDGLWKVAESGSGSGSGSGFGGQLIERVIEYKVTSGVKVDSKTADLYQFTVTNKFASGNGAFQTGSTERRWFNKKGMILKSENISTRDGSSINGTTTTYEYDPKIKIEAPEVFGETRSN